MCGQLMELLGRGARPAARSGKSRGPDSVSLEGRQHAATAEERRTGCRSAGDGAGRTVAGETGQCAAGAGRAAEERCPERYASSEARECDPRPARCERPGATEGKPAKVITIPQLVVLNEQRWTKCI